MSICDIRHIVAGGLFASVMLLSACSPLQMNGSVAFGNLFSLRDALTYSVKHCDDPAARNLAARWASIGFQDLNQSYAHMTPESPEYEYSRALASRLQSISRRTTNIKVLCYNIAGALKATDDLLSRLNTPDRRLVTVE